MPQRNLKHLTTETNFRRTTCNENKLHQSPRNNIKKNYRDV